MDGVHDMGGMAGFGPVDPSSAAPTSEPWQARAQVVTMLGADAVRAAIEAIPPDEYLAASYFERWLIAGERTAVALGRVTDGELERWRERLAVDPEAQPPRIDSPQGTDGFVSALTTTSPLAPAAAPRFGVGEQVRVRRMHPSGHHRCPRYVRGAVGVVERVAGDEYVPKASPGGALGPLEAVYTVSFASTDLWGDQTDDGEAPFELLIDLWERYLEAP